MSAGVDGRGRPPSVAVGDDAEELLDDGLRRRARASRVVDRDADPLAGASVVQQIAPSPVARPLASTARSLSASSRSTTWAVRDDASCRRSKRRCSSRWAAACRELNITAATSGTSSNGASMLWRERLNAMTPSGDAPSVVSAAVGAERASTSEKLEPLDGGEHGRGEDRVEAREAERRADRDPPRGDVVGAGVAERLEHDAGDDGRREPVPDVVEGLERRDRAARRATRLRRRRPRSRCRSVRARRTTPSARPRRA